MKMKTKQAIGKKQSAAVKFVKTVPISRKRHDFILDLVEWRCFND
jgi:hypothetical protein